MGHYEQQNDADVLEAVSSIEAAWDEAHLQEADKAWDAIHRCLSDGTLRPGTGTWPLVGAVLGGECMYFGDDHIVRFLDAHNVAEVSSALATVTHDWFAGRFATLGQHGYAGAGTSATSRTPGTGSSRCARFSPELLQRSAP